MTSFSNFLITESNETSSMEVIKHSKKGYTVKHRRSGKPILGSKMNFPKKADAMKFVKMVDKAVPKLATVDDYKEVPKKDIQRIQGFLSDMYTDGTFKYA